jgi:hypothetical protein
MGAPRWGEALGSDCVADNLPNYSIDNLHEPSESGLQWIPQLLTRITLTEARETIG